MPGPRGALCRRRGAGELGLTARSSRGGELRRGTQVGERGGAEEALRVRVDQSLHRARAGGRAAARDARVDVAQRLDGRGGAALAAAALGSTLAAALAASRAA